jgi:hypothetical protein
MSKDTFCETVTDDTQLNDQDKMMCYGRHISRDKKRCHRGDVFTVEKISQREAVIKWRIYLDVKELEFTNQEHTIRESRHFNMFNESWYMLFKEAQKDGKFYHAVFLFTQSGYTKTMSLKHNFGDSNNPISDTLENVIWDKPDKGWGVMFSPFCGNLKGSLVNFWNPKGYIDHETIVTLCNK